MLFADVIFLIAAATCLLSAMLIVVQRNPVYSVVFMLPFFLGMTTLFWILSATFLAAMQMMVYGGAILVVFLFVIMLINLRPEEIKDDFAFGPYLFAGAGVGLLGGFIAKFVLNAVNASASAHDPSATLSASFAHPLGLHDGHIFGSIESIAQALFTQYIMPFEVASVLIVVAILGAVLLSKKRV
jgi:NADH-quinone oxidoreductase subunit J